MALREFTAPELPRVNSNAARLVPILHYDGTPITARFIVKAVADMLAVVTLAPLKKALP